MSLNIEILSKAATQARGLCMDAVQASQSGHLGLPLGCAEIGAVLFGYALKYNPEQPRWINRDIFVLSGGHGSMFLYAWLHMSGYGLPMSEIKRFRQLHSKTPGHPEFGETPGVECTTGPLGQGVGNAVGISVATKMAAARFNTDEHKVFDQHVICLCSDGDMQEGVASEACALAGHWGLDNLIFLYDSNAVTLDAAAKETQSEDTGKRMEAYGFDVQEIDGHDMQQFLDAFDVAKRRDNGKPQFIIAHTLMPRVRRSGCPKNTISYHRTCPTTLPGTKRNCSPSTVVGRKRTTPGERKILRKRSCSMTDLSEKSLPIS